MSAETPKDIDLSSAPLSEAGATRRAQVSLFRPGKPPPERQIVLDQRTGRESAQLQGGFGTVNPVRVWESLTPLQSDEAALLARGLFVSTKYGEVTRHFDLLRTRLLQTMAQKGWTRLAIASPHRQGGHSFISANLGLALARLPACRTALLDLDLRAPSLATLFAVTDSHPLADFLSGEQPLEGHFRRFGRNLALGLNGEAHKAVAETFQGPNFAAAMSSLMEMLQPDLVIYDLPPLLDGDEVIALAGQVDALLLVADARRDTAQDIAACERLIEGQIPLLGVVLNRAEDLELQSRSGWLSRIWPRKRPPQARASNFPS